LWRRAIGFSEESQKRFSKGEATPTVVAVVEAIGKSEEFID
jgi:hypothetical protein